MQKKMTRLQLESRAGFSSKQSDLNSKLVEGAQIVREFEAYENAQHGDGQSGLSVTDR